MLGKGKYADVTQCKSLYTPNVGVTWWREYKDGPEEQAEITYKNMLHSYLPKRFLCGVFNSFLYSENELLQTGVAICKGIRIPESVKILFMESGILDFGIRNTAQALIL